jgi:proliferating cell nuclear antigen
MSFKAIMESSSLFKKILEAVQGLIQDANFECGPNGIYMQSMDSSCVCVVELRVSTEAFSFLRCERPISLGMSLLNLGKVFKCADPEDTLSLETLENEDEIKVQFENRDKDKLMDFNVKLMDIDQQEMGVPEMTNDCEITMSASEFQRVIRNISQIGEELTFKCKEDELILSTSGDVGNLQICLRHDDDNEEGCKILCSDSLQQSVCLRYVVLFSKATPIAAKVRINMVYGNPMCFVYETEDGNAFLKYYLAPKLSEEELQVRDEMEENEEYQC